MRRKLSQVRISIIVVLLVAAAVSIIGNRTVRVPVSHAQIGLGSTLPPGYFSGATNLSTLTVSAGAAGTVTNTSTFLMQVDGGPVYCGGNQSTIAESNVFLAANTTFLLVWNCPSEAVYAKTASLAPGSVVGTNVPTTLLYPIPGVEIPLALVVCGAATCATITDQRPLSAFPAAIMTGGTLFANLPATYPNGALVYCSNCLLASSPCTGASTGALALRVNGAWRCQ